MSENNPLEGTHIGLIPDGNRRWAEENNKEVWEGHEKGSDTLDEFIDWTLIENDVKEISVFALSTENLTRPPEEISKLVDLYMNKFKELADKTKIKKNSIKINFIGETSILPEGLKEAIEYAKEKTKSHSEKAINFLMPYGGKYEILEAARKLAEDAKNNVIDIKDITEDKFKEYLLLNSKNVDLVIRTAEKRMSNFLLWQTAYAEMFFVEKYWPSFTKQDFQEIKEGFSDRTRTYGK